MRGNHVALLVSALQRAPKDPALCARWGLSGVVVLDEWRGGCDSDERVERWTGVMLTPYTLEGV